MTARRPARRAASRRRPRRWTGHQRRRAEILVLTALVLWSTGRLLTWFAAHLWVIPVVLAVVLAAGAVWHRHRKARARRRQDAARSLRYAVQQLDRLSHREFEHAVRDLMFRDGCADAVQVGGAGDNGADVKATDPYGRRWVIQCKHRRAGLAGAAVGSPDLHVLNGTGRPVHKGDVVVLVTNGRFTGPAGDFARAQRLHLVDRRTLAAWADGHRPLWELLSSVPPPRRAGPLS